MLEQLLNKEMKIYHKAERLYEKGLKLINKSDPDGKIFLNKAIELIKDNLKMIKTMNSDFSKLLVNIGLAFQKVGDIKDSSSSYQMAIKMDSENVAAYTNYAMIRALQKDYKKAILLVEKALQIDIQSKEAWETKAEIYQLKGDIDEALDIYKKLINLYPNELTYYDKYLEYRPKDIEILFKKGVHLYKIQSYAECVKVMKEIVSINVEYQQAWVYLGAAYAKMDRMVDAINALKKAIKIDPNDKLSWINLSILHKKRGEYEEALKCVKEAIKIDPNDKKSWYLEASILHLMDRDSEALKAVNKALEHDSRYLDALILKRELAKKLKMYDDLIDACIGLLDVGNEDIDIMYDLALAYYMRDYLDKSLDITLNILKRLPRHLPTLKLQRDIMKKKKQWDRVISICEDILKIEPKDIDSLVDEAIAYKNLGKLESALNFITQATELQPSNINLWKLRKNIAKELNKPQEIINAATQIIAMGGDFETYRDLARAYYILSRYDDAKKTLEKGLKLKEDDDEGWNLLGMIYYKLGDLEHARYSFKKATEINPNEKKYWKNLAWTMEKLDKFEEAVEYYDMALKLDPHDMRLWYEKGICLKNIKKYEDALKSFDSALEINKNFTKAMFEKGNVLIKMKKYEDALRIFDSLVKLEPTNSEYIYKRAYVRFKKMEYEAALKDLELALNYERKEKYMELKKDICKALKNLDCVIDTAKDILTMNKKNILAWRDLCAAYESMGKIDSAIAKYREALDIFPDNEVLLYELKDLLMKHERFADAVEVCKNILAISPEDYQNLIDLGFSLINLKKYEEAREYLVRAAQLNKNAKVLELLGDVDYYLQNYESSIENYTDALNLEERAELYYKIAKAYYKNKDFENSLHYIEKAIERDKDARFYLLASRVYLALDDLDMAQKYAKTAFDMEDNENTRINLATILFKMKRFRDVINILKPVAKKKHPEALKLLGQSLEAEHRFEDAIKIYTQVTDLDKRDKDTWKSIGRCYLSLKNFEGAIKAYERAYLIDPKDVDTCSALAFAYENNKMLKKALEFINKGIDLDPNNVHLWTSKGFLLMKMDQIEEALKSFEKALEIQPDLTAAKEGKIDCERILEERELEKYARKILLYEYKTGKKVNKKDAFRNLNVPLSLISKVFTYINSPESVDVSRLNDELKKKYEDLTLKIAKKLNKIENLSLQEIIGNFDFKVKTAKKLLAYIEYCLNSEVSKTPSKEDEVLLKKVLDLDLKDLSILNLMMNLNVGICRAKFIRYLLRMLEEETEEVPPPSTTSISQPAPETPTESSNDNEEESFL